MCTFIIARFFISRAHFRSCNLIYLFYISKLEVVVQDGKRGESTEHHGYGLRWDKFFE